MGSKSKPGQDIDDGFFELPLSDSNNTELVIDHGRNRKKQASEKPVAPKKQSALEEVVAVNHGENPKELVEPEAPIPQMIVSSSVPQTEAPTLRNDFDQNWGLMTDSQSPSNDYQAEPSRPERLPSQDEIVVPGGVSNIVPDVSAFFNSRYRNRRVGHQQTARTLPQSYGAQQAFPAPNPGLGYAPKASPVRADWKRSGFIRFGIFGGVIFGVILLVLTIFILPNRPMNVYKTAMERSSKGLGDFRKSALSTQRMSELSSSEISGEVKIKNQSLDVEAALSGSFVPSRVSVAAEGNNNASGTNFNASAMSDFEAFMRPKDTVIKIGGDPATLELMKNGFSGYGEKWILVTPETTAGAISQYSDAYSSLMPGLQLASQAGSSYKADLFNDATTAEFLDVMTQSFTEYVLSVSENAVFDAPEEVGTFEEDGIKGRKYAVQFNKSNYGAYCKTQREAVLRSESFVTLTASSPDKIEELAVANDSFCEDAAISAGDGKTFEVWVDSKHKIVAKIRASLDASSDDYVEIGQRFVSGDAIELYVGIGAAEQDASSRLGLVLDKTKNEAEIVVKRQSGEDSKAELRLKFIPKDQDDLLVDKPVPQASSVDLQNSLGLDLLELLSPPNPNTFL